MKNEEVTDSSGFVWIDHAWRRKGERMRFSANDSGALGILTLQGCLNESHAEELRAHLAHGLNRMDRLLINCGQAVSLDLICIKLLCTAYRAAQMLHKELVLAGDRGALLRRAAGTVAHSCAGARQGCEGGCLWEDGHGG